MALVAALSTASPTLAQQTLTQQTFARESGETAMQMASRIGACDQAGISRAVFTEGGSILRVTCVGGVGLSGGLGTAAAAGAAIVAIALFADDDDDSSSSTTTTTTTN